MKKFIQHWSNRHRSVILDISHILEVREMWLYLCFGTLMWLQIFKTSLIVGLCVSLSSVTLGVHIFPVKSIGCPLSARHSGCVPTLLLGCTQVSTCLYHRGSPVKIILFITSKKFRNVASYNLSGLVWACLGLIWF